MFLNQKDLDHSYDIVKDLSGMLVDTSPETASTFMSQANSRDKSPFDILVRMNRKLVMSLRNRTTLS